MTDPVATATSLADDVLFPAALATDASELVPAENLDALAAAGMYGLFVPPELGGLGADFETTCDVVEIIASGCLSTALVWVQHFGLLGSLMDAPDPLAAWLPEAARGQRRGGIAFGGVRAGPSPLIATPDGEGWILDGFEPFVSGWGRIDTLHVGARGPDETVVHVAIDAVEGDGVDVRRQRLAAVDASGTVRVELTSVRVPKERVLGTEPHNPSGSGGAAARFTASLALGVARRCCQLLDFARFDDELQQRRHQLTSVGEDQIAGARAQVSEFALRAAGALVVHGGSKSIVSGHHAQRLLREAMFVLVFATSRQTKDALIAGLARPGA